MKKITTLIIAVSIFLIDRTTKLLIQNILHEGEFINVWREFFSLYYIRNDGAIFGILAGWNSLFIGMTIAIVCIMVIILFKERANTFTFQIGLGLIIGGALGNLYDRIFEGAVLDFLDFGIGRYRWPTFNIADLNISIGVVMILLAVLVTKRNQEFS